MEIEYDNNKRLKTLSERGLDFQQCGHIFHGPHIDLTDDRTDYGEKRIITFGFLNGREIVIVWTQRGENRRIISMRKANEREKHAFYQQLG